MYTNLPVNTIVRLPHPRSGDSQGQETFLAPSADKQTHNHDTRGLKLPSLPTNPKVKRIEPQQDEMVSRIYKFTSECYGQTTPPPQRIYICIYITYIYIIYMYIIYIYNINFHIQL